MPFLVVDFHLLGGPEARQNRHDAGDGILFAELDVFENLVAEPHEFRRPGQVEVFGSPHHHRLDPFVAHDGADAATAGTGAALFDGSEIDPVFAGQANGRHLGLGLVELLFDQFGGFDGAFTVQVGGVPNFHGVVVDPDIDQARGFAAQDDLVITGKLQLGCKETAHHGKGHELRLGRDGRYDGPVTAGGRCAAQQAGAENQQIVRRKGLDFGRNPVP